MQLRAPIYVEQQHAAAAVMAMMMQGASSKKCSHPSTPGKCCCCRTGQAAPLRPHTASTSTETCKAEGCWRLFQVWASIHQHGLQPNQCLNLVLTYPADAGAYQFSCIDSAVYIQIVTKKDDEPKSCWQQNRLMFLHDLYLKNGPSEKPQNKYVYILAA